MSQETENQNWIGRQIGRFRIDRLIGKGGMGNVYEGYDELLGRKVAIKALRGFEENKITQLLSEARALSRLDHRNICRIYDLLEIPEGHFLVLEFLEGTTLKSAMKKGLSASEKLNIAMQLTEALQAAGQAGITHRDLKPDNVVLTAKCLKVLDFGLATSVFGETNASNSNGSSGSLSGNTDPSQDRDAGDLSSNVTLPDQPSFNLGNQGALVGTPRYMSPEQARGEPLHPSSDLYALGLIFQELITEQPAYSKRIPTIQLLMKVANGETQMLPPEGVDPDWRALIEALLQKNPKERPNPGEVLRRLKHIQGKPLLKRRRIWVLAALVTALLISSVGGWFFSSNDHFPAAFKNPVGSVALLPVVNQTGRAQNDWARIGLMEIVGENLARLNQLSFISAADTLRALKNHDLESLQVGGENMLDRIRQQLGADLLIQATLQEVNGKFQLAYRLFADDGVSAMRVAEASTPLEAARHLARRVAHRIEPDALSWAFDDGYSDDPVANLLYGIAVERMLTSGAKEALPFFKVSCSLDPQFEMAAIKQASAHYDLGDFETSRQLLADVLEKHASDDDPLVLGQAHLELGRVLRRLGQVPEAERHMLRAIEYFKREGDLLNQAHAARQLGNLAFGTGQWDQAGSLWQQALDTYREHGNMFGQSHALNNLAVLAGRRSQFEAAAKLHHRALEIRRELGDMSGQAISYNNLGALYSYMGQNDAAFHSFAEAKTRFEALGETNNMLLAFNNMGILALRAEAPFLAEQVLEEALAQAQTFDAPFVEARICENLAEVKRIFDDTDQVYQHACRALEIGQQIKNLELEAGGNQVLGLLHHDLGQYQQSMARLENALSLYRRVGDPLKIVEVHAQMGDVYLSAGQLEQAHNMLMTCLSLIGDHQLDPGIVHLYLAEYHMQQGQLGLARESLDIAVDEGISPVRSAKLHAVLRYREGHPVQAIAILETLKDEQPAYWDNSSQTTLDRMRRGSF